MKKQILVASLLVGALTTSVLAYNQNCPNFGQRGMQGNMQGMQQGMMMNQGTQMQGRMQGMQGGMRGMQGGGMMQMFANIDLTQEQQYQLSILRDEMRLEMKKSMGMNQRPDFSEFITKDGFDEDAFVKSMNERHKKMTVLRAEHMKKVFSILTPEQIKKLQAKN